MPDKKPAKKSIIQQIKDAIVGDFDEKGRPVGTGGRTRYNRMEQMEEEALTGRRRNQSTDEANGY